ncbi:MAG: hypothetical protein ABMB14_09020 [Myxococcota bacterium]
MLFVFVITTFWFAWKLAAAKEAAEVERDRLMDAEKKARELIGTLDAPGAVTACLRDSARAGAWLEATPQGSEARVSLYLSDGAEWFVTGESRLQDRQLAAAARIRTCIRELVGRPDLAGYRVRVHLEGHTDTRPVRGGLSNWELSGARAAAVLREVLREGGPIEAAQADGRLELVAVGMADLKPAWGRICSETHAQSVGSIVSGRDGELCERLEQLAKDDANATTTEAWRSTLLDFRDLYDSRDAGCRPRAGLDLEAQTGLDLLRLWANRCVDPGQNDNPRLGLLRRVDLRLELTPRLERPAEVAP